MRLLVGVPVLVNGRLDVGVAQLLLDEVDRLVGSEPEGCSGVAQIMETDRGGEAGVFEGSVVAATADVVAVQHEAFGAPEDKLVEATAGRLSFAVLPQDVEEEVVEEDDP